MSDEAELGGCGGSIYVISLPHRLDRQAHIRAQLVGAPFLYSFDVRARSPQPDSADGLSMFPWKMHSENPWWNRNLKRGEVDCFLSHVECWEDAAQRRDKRFHIFLEDDALLPAEGLPALLQHATKLGHLDIEWDLLYLGREPLEPDRGRIDDFILPGYSYCTFAYALSDRGIGKLLRYDPRRCVMPVDEFLPATYLVHPRRDIANLIRPTLRAYATAPDLVLEAPKARFGSDTERSPEIVV